MKLILQILVSMRLVHRCWRKYITSTIKDVKLGLMNRRKNLWKRIMDLSLLILEGVAMRRRQEILRGWEVLLLL